MKTDNFDTVNAHLATIAEEMRQADIQDAIDGFVGQYRSEWVGDIADMHSKFGVNAVVRKLSPDKLLKFIEFRLNFLQEELDEARKAYATLVDLQTSEINPEARATMITATADDIVDAMTDLSVVAIGTLDALDVDADLAWDRVYGANICKEPGIKPERPNPLGLPDLIKPAGWVAPQHSDNIGLMHSLI